MVSVTFIQPNGLPCGIKWSAWTDPAWVDVPRTLLRARFRPQTARSQRPAAVDRVSQLTEFTRIELAAEEIPIRQLPLAIGLSQPLILLMHRNELVRHAHVVG